ncbi:MAG: hypothetical protein RLZZ387_1623 [Chloroflexota bacterium]|jgi:hypothetical protein
MDELRSLFAVRIVRGALLRADGSAVGLVCGGAPAWELVSRGARSNAGEDYHRLLLALDGPLDIYLFDQPHDVVGEMALLLERQARALDEGRDEHAAVLGDICGYLADLAHHSGGRAKQIVWAVTSGDGAQAGEGALDLAGMLRGRSPARAGETHAAGGRSSLAQAVERARRLADALEALGGTPGPRLMEPEEVASLLYRHADPVRAQRYPLAGSLLERVRRVVTTAGERSGA